MQSYKTMPFLGRKTDVPANDSAMFGPGNITHDAGGLNFDLYRMRNACSRAKGYSEWSSAANAQATKCMGLFELYDGTNRNYIMFDNGKVYTYDSARAPVNVDAATPVTFANDDQDLYSVTKVGDYVVFADRAEHTPYKWKHGDANLSKLIASGTEYKFRYLVMFQRRVVSLFSDQTDGAIEVRWSTDFPTTAVTSLNYPAANQLFIPNDDPITGGATMGNDRMYIYSENSINQLVYYPDYELPFRINTVVSDQGCASHHSIVTVGNSHYFFNRGYGFCEYRGGNQFPYGGRPISEDIEKDLQNINSTYYDMIDGVFVPLTREIVWTVAMEGSTTNNRLLFYNLDSGQWRFEDKAMRRLDNWTAFTDYEWNDLIIDLGGVWSAAGSRTWSYYVAERQRLMFSNRDGKLYTQSGESLNGATMEGHRVEPIIDFGDPEVNTFLKEIWFDIGETGAFDLDVYHRGGDTVGEVNRATWVQVPSLSMDNPDRPIVNVAKNARLHQIKWGTSGVNEKFEIHAITYKYDQRSDR